MKPIILAQVGTHQTVTYAVDELRRYLSQIDAEREIVCLEFDRYDPSCADYLWVGENLLPDAIPTVEDPVIDDAVFVDATDFHGVISGSNTRSVLFSVYRFLKELGCRFFRPGKDGETVPRHPLTECSVKICETPSYRNRVVCIEGGCSYENVFDMIDFMPKVGLNGYYMQFLVPFIFFARWYEHENNPYLQEEAVPVPHEFVRSMHRRLRLEMQKRSIFLSEVGHGFSVAPFGIDNGSWRVLPEDQVPPSTVPYLAMLNGKRGLNKGIPYFTQLCYSNPEVRRIMIDAMIDYCHEFPEMDVFNISLADGENNYCECPECRKKTPSDWMIVLLNELDERMTAEGLPQKVVWDIYIDSLWVAKEEKIKNPARFIGQFSPITRSYQKSYKEIDPEITVPVPSFSLNHNHYPGKPDVNLQMLRDWKKYDNRMEMMLYDFHLYTVFLYDFGQEAISRVLCDDISSLEKHGLNGLVSCQVQRCAFPTALPFIVMAETLWNKDADYEQVANAHYAATFGDGWEKAREYCLTLSQKISTEDYYGYAYFASLSNEEKLANLDVASKAIATMKTTAKEKEQTALCDSQKASWHYLTYHTEYMRLVVAMLRARYEQKQEEFIRCRDAVIDYLARNELNLQPVYDYSRIFCALEYGRFKDM